MYGKTIRCQVFGEQDSCVVPNCHLANNSLAIKGNAYPCMEKSGGCHFNSGIKLNSTKDGASLTCTPNMIQYEVNGITYETVLPFNLSHSIQGLGKQVKWDHKETVKFRMMQDIQQDDKLILSLQSLQMQIKKMLRQF